MEKDILTASSGGNIHMAEERQQVQQKDTDEHEEDEGEELKYSGVYRPSEQNKIHNNLQ